MCRREIAMRFVWLTKCTFFLLGILAASLFCVLRDHQKKRTTVDNPCEREIDIALGKAIMNKIPTLDEVSQLLGSNRLENAQSVLCDHIWWELKGAWYVNNRHSGSLDADLRPLLIDVYPRLKRQVYLGHFARWPKRTLVEMTNFMEE